MQFPEQHVEAVRPTIRVKNEVCASIFSDKVKEMGSLVASKGTITIKLDYLPSMVTDEAQAQFVADSIGIAIKEAMLAHLDAFDPHAQ